MARSGGLIHHKLPPDAVIHTRNPIPTEVENKESSEPAAEQLAAVRFLATFGQIARELENRSKPVDEYNSAAISGAGSSAQVVVQPTYEYMPEKIESVVITGPTGAVTLALGDRTWALTIPASGVIVIAPIAILLGRTDARTLTPSTAGVYTLELMGIADKRFGV